MAVVKPKPAAATSAPAPVAAAAVSGGGGVASMLPDEMLAGGLMDDFDGRILKVRNVPWDYNGNIDHHILAVAVTIKPDDSDEFVQHYSAGELDNFVPSNDPTGATHVDLENGEGEALEGIYFARVGKKEQLSNSSNWAAFVVAALEANFPREVIVAAKGACNFAEGTYAHFNRVPQKKRTGIVANVSADPTKKARNNDILVITEIKEAPKVAGSAPAAKTAKPAAAPVATTAPVGESLEDQVANALAPVVMAASAEDGLSKTELAPVILKAFTGAAKAKALKLISNEEFLSNRDEWGYDPDTGTLYQP